MSQRVLTTPAGLTGTADVPAAGRTADPTLTGVSQVSYACRGGVTRSLRPGGSPAQAQARPAAVGSVLVPTRPATTADTQPGQAANCLNLLADSGRLPKPKAPARGRAAKLRRRRAIALDFKVFF